MSPERRDTEARPQAPRALMRPTQEAFPSTRQAVIAAVLVLASLPCSRFVRASEICDNCMDDDDDALVDCYDPECAGDAVACRDMFLDRVLPPPDCAPALVLQELWVYPAGDWAMVPAVGDIDADGMPEVVVSAELRYALATLDGATGRVERTSLPASWGTGNYVIGDVDDDGTAEIFAGTRVSPVGSHAVACWEHDASLRYEYFDGANTDNDQSGLGLADFDGDGRPEVYNMGMVYDANDGRQVVDVGTPLHLAATRYSLAADVVPDEGCATCAGLELVGSWTAWGIDPSSGSFELAGAAGTGRPRGSHVIVDWNGDGKLDVMVNAPAGGPFATGSLVVWDPRTGSDIASVGVPYGSSNSAPCVADFDGDGELEVAIVIQLAFGATRVFRVYDHDLSVLRDIAITENSEWVSAQAFDFTSDGIPELAFRDAANVQIVDVRDGRVLASARCVSGTGHERIVVADVNADGQADILSGCDPTGLIAWSVLGSPAARQVMNQWHYDIVNVNDDLTIPCAQQDKAAPGLPSFLNGAMLQAPLLSDAMSPGERCRCPAPPRAAIVPLDPACDGNGVLLDASPSTGCSAGRRYRWVDDQGVPACDWSDSPTCGVVLGASRSYALQVACSEDPLCRASALVPLDTLAPAVGPPPGPALRATGKSETSIDLTWCLARPLEAHEHAHVLRATRASDPFTLIAPLPHALDFRACTFTDANAPDSLYFYVIRFASCGEEETE